MSMTIDRDRLPPQWKVAGSSLRHGATLTAADGRMRYWTGLDWNGLDCAALHFTSYRMEREPGHACGNGRTAEPSMSLIWS